jgi:pimeloyl-ACP methyl ester carboxylesterase
MTTRSRVIVLSVGASILLIIVALVGAMLLRPLATFETFERWRLSLAGMERVEVSGPRGPLVYWRGGAGPAVFFLHGANDQAGAWARAIRPLLGSYRIILADLPGHGESGPADGPLSIKDLVDGVEAVVEAEAKTGRVTIAGNSLGGWLALIYADRHPDRVSHVVLVNGAAIRGDGSEAKVNLLPKTREEARAAVQATTSPASAAVPSFVLDDLVRRAPGSPLARLMAAPPPPEEYFVDARLGEFRTPVSLVWGEDDKVLPLSYAKKVSEALPASRLARIPACGHIPQRECADQMWRVLEVVLSEPPPHR